jgi:hypothetical protein
MFSKLRPATQNGFQPVYASCRSNRSVHFGNEHMTRGDTEEVFGWYRYFSATFKEWVRA